jgi:ABC-2 type transport system ATP-binding protein
LELVGLEEGKRRKIGQYSGGMKQRLGIAQALIHQPKLILLDEPVSALDPFGRKEVLELMQRLKAETTILFSTHILNDAEAVSDHVLFMNEGKIIEAGTLQEVQSRHAEQMIHLHFDTAAVPFVTLFQQYDVHVDGNTLVLHSENMEADKHKVLQIVAHEKLPLTKFTLAAATLEEIFMKVVKK